ncbi:MAG: hypothetical protein E6G84_15985, partial [Alphaproteobacteria bacterium]
GGSRALPVAGTALHEASKEIVEKGRQVAGNLLEASPADIEFGEGEFRIVGTDRRVDLFTVAAAARDPSKLPPGMEPGLDATHTRTPTAETFPNGCHIAEGGMKLRRRISSGASLSSRAAASTRRSIR